MGSNLKRGNVFWVNLDPARGSEIAKLRLCVMVGATPINQARRTVETGDRFLLNLVHNCAIKKL